MTAAPVLAFQLFFNVMVWSLVARWYVAPRLARLPLHEALVPPIFVHLVRPISLWTTVPGVVVHDSMPQGWATSTAVGDLIATALAVASLFALRRRMARAIHLVWIFNLVGFLDAIKNGILAARWGVVPHMGAAVIIPSYGVPVLLVSHGIVFWLLGSRRVHG
jgi:hypothetical protein